jgi:hypothetical protein
MSIDTAWAVESPIPPQRLSIFSNIIVWADPSVYHRQDPPRWLDVTTPGIPPTLRWAPRIPVWKVLHLWESLFRSKRKYGKRYGSLSCYVILQRYAISVHAGDADVSSPSTDTNTNRLRPTQLVLSLLYFLSLKKSHLYQSVVWQQHTFWHRVSNHFKNKIPEELRKWCVFVLGPNLQL